MDPKDKTEKTTFETSNWLNTPRSKSLLLEDDSLNQLKMGYEHPSADFGDNWNSNDSDSSFNVDN